MNDAYEQTGQEPTRKLMRRYRGLDGKQKSLNVRYVGSLVADFHRNLLGGGIFCYPANANRRWASFACCTKPTRLHSSPNRRRFRVRGFKRILDVDRGSCTTHTALLGSKAEVDTVSEFPLENMFAARHPGAPCNAIHRHSVLQVPQ